MGKILENKNIEIDKETLKTLNITRKWTMFLAVAGFIFIGIMIIVGVITGLFLSVFNTGMKGPGLQESFILIMLSVVAITFSFSVFFLFRFSKHTRNVINTLNNIEIVKALKNLKLFFVYLGVLIIILLTFYIIALIIAGSTMAFLKGG